MTLLTKARATADAAAADAQRRREEDAQRRIETDIEAFRHGSGGYEATYLDMIQYTIRVRESGRDTVATFRRYQVDDAIFWATNPSFDTTSFYLEQRCSQCGKPAIHTTATTTHVPRKREEFEGSVATVVSWGDVKCPTCRSGLPPSHPDCRRCHQ